MDPGVFADSYEREASAIRHAALDRLAVDVVLAHGISMLDVVHDFDEFSALSLAATSPSPLWSVLSHVAAAHGLPAKLRIAPLVWAAFGAKLEAAYLPNPVRGAVRAAVVVVIHCGVRRDP